MGKNLIDRKHCRCYIERIKRGLTFILGGN